MNPTSPVTTRVDLASADVAVLLNELDAFLEPLYAAESQHGYSVDELIAQQVTFFVVYLDGTPAGCGGIQLFDTEYAELKRMYVREECRGMGLGKMLIAELTEYALAHGITLLRLETGIHQAAAIRLYERMGFQRVPPFGNYRDDPLCVFYEKRSKERMR